MNVSHSKVKLVHVSGCLSQRLMYVSWRVWLQFCPSEVKGAPHTSSPGSSPPDQPLLNPFTPISQGSCGSPRDSTPGLCLLRQGLAGFPVLGPGFISSHHLATSQNWPDTLRTLGRQPEPCLKTDGARWARLLCLQGNGVPWDSSKNVSWGLKEQVSPWKVQERPHLAACKAFIPWAKWGRVDIWWGL